MHQLQQVNRYPEPRSSAPQYAPESSGPFPNSDCVNPLILQKDPMLVISTISSTVVPPVQYGP